MIAFIILICGALMTVTQTYSWLWLVIGIGFVSLGWYRQWLELALASLLLIQVLFIPMVTPLTQAQPLQSALIVITSMPTPTPTGCKAYGMSGETKWLVTQRADVCELAYGAQLHVEATPVPITGLQNFQLFNRQQFYARQKQVVGELQVKTVIGSSRTNPRYQQQVALLTWIQQRIPDPVVQMLVKTMILGETSDFDDSVRSVWQTLNISHILAISGLHAAIFIVLLQWGLQRLRIVKQLHPWLIGAVLLILRWYNFASVSFTRIVCMWFVSLLFGKRLSQYHKLLIALAVIAVLMPMELLGIGLYYSFTCAFLLTLGHKFWRSKLSIVTLPFTLQLWLLPVTFWQSGQFLPISLLANMLAIPFISILVPGLLLVIAIPQAAPLIRTFYELGVSLFDWLLVQFPFTMTLGQISLCACVVASVLTYLCYRAIEQRAWWRALVMSVLLLASFSFASRAQPEVTMLDIGQGDAIVVIDERKKAFVIDTGGPMKLETRHLTQETVVESYLLRRGVTTIETLVISHADLDHLGYAFALLARGQVKVENLILAQAQELTSEEQRLLTLAHQVGTHVQFVNVADTIQFGQLTFQVLAPLTPVRTDINNHSLVLYSQIGGLNWLFTGDIERSVEHQLVATYPNLAVDVLKVAHHGSKTSSSLFFLQAYQPRYGLISAGRNNRFNHPHPEIVEQLQAAFVQTASTNEVGMIRYRYLDQTWQCFQADACQHFQ